MRHSLQRLAVLILVGATVVTVAAQAALPPLSHQQKMQYSTHVFTGKVWGIETKVAENKHNPNGEWSNTHYRLTVEVEKVYQTATKTRTAVAGLQGGDADVDETLLEKTLVYVLFWKAGKRPMGFVGDGGLVSDLPIEGESYSFFAHYLGSTPLERSVYQHTFPYKRIDDNSAAPTQRPHHVTAANNKGEAQPRDGKDEVASDHSYSLLVPNGLAGLEELDPRRAEQERIRTLERKLKRSEAVGKITQVREAGVPEDVDRAQKVRAANLADVGVPVEGAAKKKYVSHNAKLKEGNGATANNQEDGVVTPAHQGDHVGASEGVKTGAVEDPTTPEAAEDDDF